MYRLPFIFSLLLTVSLFSTSYADTHSDTKATVNLWKTVATKTADASQWHKYGNNVITDTGSFIKIVIKDDKRGAYLYLDKILPALNTKDNKNYKIIFNMYASGIKNNSEVVIKYESLPSAMKYKITTEKKQYEGYIANTKRNRVLIKFNALAKGAIVYVDKNINIEQMIKRDYVQPFKKPFKGATLDMNRPRTLEEIQKWFFDLHKAGARYVRIQANPKVSMNAFSKMEYLADIVNRFNIKYLPIIQQYDMKVLFAMESIPYDTPALNNRKNKGFWDNPGTVQNFRDTAHYIANAFKKTNEIFALQFMSEPVNDSNQVPRNWYQISNEVIKIVRKYTNKFIAWSPGLGGRPSYSFLVPLEDDRIIYNFHEFVPHRYTHQGIKGNPLNIPYSKNKTLVKDIMSIVAFRERNNNIPIMCGSYSLANWIPDGNLWLKDVTGQLQVNDISSFQFATGQFKAWDWRYRSVNNGKTMIYTYDITSTNKLWTGLSKYWKL